MQACGTDEFGHQNLCDDDPATIGYSDVSTAPSLIKTASAPVVQVDVRFDVLVTNNSTLDTLTLNTLADNKFGKIDTPHAAGTQANAFCNGLATCGAVISTECNTAAGTVLQKSPTNNTYSCHFVGRITTTGLHTNRVAGTATDDDAVDYSDPPLGDNAAVQIDVTFP